jgi:hypothetical protein
VPAPLPLPLRQRIYELGNAALDASRIARLVSVPGRTVRRLLAAWRDGPQPPDLAPLAPAGGRRLAEDRQPVLESCLRLRRENPAWGAGRLWVELRRGHPPQAVPPRAPCSAGCARPA